MAYHPQDNFLYGVGQNRNGAFIYRIGANGVSTNTTFKIPQFDFTNGVYMTSGEIDNNYQYWIAYNKGQNYVQVDMDNTSVTYGQIIKSGATIGLSTYITVSDWAYIPSYTAHLFSLGGQNSSNTFSSYLLSFNTLTLTWSQVVQYSNSSGSTGGTAGLAAWGAIYSTDDGYLYGTENNSGGIFKGKIVTPTAADFSFVAQGPIGSSNDGARCLNAPKSL